MLENWLSKVNTEITENISELSPKSIGQSIKIHKSLFPDLSDCQVVIFSDNSEQMNQIRAQFYEMYHHFDNLSIADLGDLRKTDSNFLLSFFKDILESNILPIIITENKELIHTFHYALNGFQESFDVLNCDKRISEKNENDYAMCSKITSLGVQGHFNSMEALRNDNIVRISDIKDQIDEAEPYTRTVKTISFDLNTIRHSEIPGFRDASPSGLSSEEATQLFRFFGFNDRLQALFIHGYDTQYDFNYQTSQLIAQLLWYFMDAKNLCIQENINSNEEFNEFIVDIEGLTEPLAFIKAKKSGRWWIKSKNDNELIPCSYNDYLLACKNEIPDRLVNF